MIQIRSVSKVISVLLWAATDSSETFAQRRNPW